MSLNSSSSLRPSPHDCRVSRLNISNSTALVVAYYVFLLPVFVSVVYLGCQRWRKRRSGATATTTSHSDIFTFHMVALEIIGVLGSFFYCYGIYTDRRSITEASSQMFGMIAPGKTLFHLLTCVERYLAVVHPITYLGLRQAGGVRIRNISVGWVWLICFGSVAPSWYIDHFYIIHTFILLVVATVVVSFCCLSVLCILIRPGPGDVGGNRERVDQSKQRAFYTIMVITGTLLLMFLSSLVSTALYIRSITTASPDIDFCLLEVVVAWFSLPSSLVLPLLFLHRAGKLPDCKHRLSKPG